MSAAAPAPAHKIAVIAGDGIGIDVTREATRVLQFYRDEAGLPLLPWELDLGAERYLQEGVALPDDVLAQIRGECRAVLIGALGDPRVPDMEHARAILFGIRFGCDLYANIRPVKALADALVPLKNKSANDVDFVVFRENTEGAYAHVGGQLRRGTEHEIAINEDIHTHRGVTRIVVAAFEYARSNGRNRVHMADKSNAMRHAHDLWQRVFADVQTRYPEIEARHLYIDALCLELVRAPEQFQVIVTNNLFGDIVSDLAAALQGGLGMAPSANVHASDRGRVALFEPVHGSAPPLAGKDIANPFAAFLTVGMLLAHLGYPGEEQRIARAVAGAVQAGACTRDVGGTLGTRAASDAVIARLRSSLRIDGPSVAAAAVDLRR